MTLEGMTFLLAEIWGLLALAGLVGVLSGWLIWGGRSAAARDLTARNDEIQRLRAELQRARAQAVWADDAGEDIPPMQGGGYRRPEAALAPGEVPAQAAVTPQPVPGLAPIAAPNPLRTAPKPTPDKTGKPGTLAEPRDGIADDLTRIKGVGRKIATACNRLGIWHYDQIAAWTPENIAWMESHLGGPKGRIARDDWVAQAQTLSGAGEPLFKHR
ncbi:NADH-quinone oxidoreductase subunit E [Thalassorhabdomicrobium marinisediminis]|uniref:NADH-quinone oxidoreductase subunit E n=1 Tax=Thalassorhabdomicrobium marinisediminis TaxID=2170577 RepID=UPI0024927DA6|nr:NADH-quinone oxidoreductase subunit E [Thalassorhabdomicrobium marinisediminis]